MVNAFEETAWFDHADCQGQSPLFFTDEYGAYAARAICEGCPVRTDCLNYAIAHNITDGVWGGMTAVQRKRYRHDLRRRAARS